MSKSDNAFSLGNILAGIIVTVIGGVILAFILQDARFAPLPPTENEAIPSATPEQSQVIDSGDKAIQVLSDRIRRDNLYSGWSSMTCLTYMIESENRASFDIAIREKHGEDCPGDPNTAPVVDRFRVYSDGVVLWRDFLSGNFVGYEEVKKLRLQP
jgi:hypothetical protein